MVKHILTVCTGNICRSPMAQAMLDDMAGRRGLAIEVDSAGIGALVGMVPHEHAQTVMSEAGLEIGGQEAMQCDADNLGRADLILALDAGHVRWLNKHFPAIRGRVMLLGKWSDDADVPDPYGHGLPYFRSTRDQMLLYCKQWCDRLSQIV